jgi:photosystem II stability/assembly factor-like uncharacterized protein
MKKSLLTLMTAALSLSAFAQTPSPFWNTIQNTNFTVSAAGIRWIDAVSANDVWAVGYDGFAPNRNYNWFTRSTNGGALFTSGEIFPGDTSTYVLANLNAIDDSIAWVSSYMKATGNKGAVHQTTNGGTTWTNVTPAGSYTNNASFVNLVCFVTPSIGIIQGDPVGNEFEIWRTTDGGISWTKVPGANIPNPASASEYGTVNIYTKYGSNDIWFGTNANRIFHSNDGGLNWTVSAALTSTIGTAVGIDDLAFTDANNGLVTAWFGSPSTLTLWSTNDGGVTFTQIPTIDPNYGRNDVCAIAGTSWYASCGAASTNTVISYSFDNGTTWNSWGGSGIQYLYLDFFDNINAWAGSFSSQVTIGLEGIFKYSGTPLGVVNNASIPLAINMYPNPSNGIITINMPPAKEGAVITVFDVLGKQVYSHNLKTAGFEEFKLNLQHLGKGIYSINIAKGNEMSTQKVIIE